MEDFLLDTYNEDDYQQGDTVSLYSNTLKMYVKMFYVRFEQTGIKRGVLKVITSKGVECKLYITPSMVIKFYTSRMVLIEKKLKAKEIK